MLNVHSISPRIGYYLAGFADGEGSFMLILRHREDYKHGWKFSLCFNVSQKESYILSQFKKHLQCGTLRCRPDGVCYYEVNNFTSVWENIIPFFKKYSFLSQNKRLQFSLFCQAAKIFNDGAHLTPEGKSQLISIRNRMNSGGKGTRRGSPETICQTP